MCGASFNPAALVRRAGREGSPKTPSVSWLPQPAGAHHPRKGPRTPGPTILHRVATALDVDVLKLTSATLRTATMSDLRARAGLTKTATVGAPAGEGQAQPDEQQQRAAQGVATIAPC